MGTGDHRRSSLVEQWGWDQTAVRASWVGDKVTRFQKWGWEKKEPSTAESRWRGNHNSSSFLLKSQERLEYVYTQYWGEKTNLGKRLKIEHTEKRDDEGFLRRKKGWGRDSGGPTQLEEAEISYPWSCKKKRDGEDVGNCGDGQEGVHAWCLVPPLWPRKQDSCLLRGLRGRRTAGKVWRTCRARRNQLDC